MTAAFRSGAFVLSLALGACGARSPLEAGELMVDPVSEREHPPLLEPKPKVSDKPQRIPDPQPEPEHEEEPLGTVYVTIGGCSQVCQGGCSYAGLVVGTLLATGEQVIPVSLAPEDYRNAAGFTCATKLPRGAELLLEARIEPGFRFVEWMNSLAIDLVWGACPCMGSTDHICAFAVDETAYCGAVYARQY